MYTAIDQNDVFYLDLDFDPFLGIGKKAKARKRKRRDRKSQKRNLRVQRKTLKVERRKLKNDQRRANTESIRSGNKINETIVAPTQNQPQLINNPVNQDAIQQLSKSPFQGAESIPNEPQTDHTLQYAAAGLVVLILAGIVVYKLKNRQAIN